MLLELEDQKLDMVRGQATRSEVAIWRAQILRAVLFARAIDKRIE